MLLLRSGSPPHRAVLQPAQPPRLHGGNGAPGGPGLRSRQPRPGGSPGGELPLPQRGPPERHRGDRALPPPGRDPRLLRQPGPPRGRGRRRSGERRRLSGDLPGRSDHPPGQDRAGGEDRGRRLPAGACPDPLQARDRGRLPGAVRGQQHRGAAPGGAVRTPRSGDGALLHGRTHRLHRPAHTGGAREAAQGRVPRRGLRGQRWIHRPARASGGAGGDRRRGGCCSTSRARIRNAAPL